MSEPALLTTGRSELVWVAGADAVSFLDGLLSQSIAGIRVGGTARSLLLAPNGKLRATLFVLRGEERVGLVCDRGLVGVVAGDLRRFKIRVDVELSIEQRDIWEVWGTAAVDVVDNLPPAGTWIEVGDMIGFRMPFRRVPTERIVVVGARPAGDIASSDELEVVRIAAGEPVVGVDVDDKTIPQEIGDVTVDVDFEKGCYLGQELVARIDSRGHVNRRLTGLELSAEDAPEPGTAVLIDDKVVGNVTSSVQVPVGGVVIALAMLRTEVGPGTVVAVSGDRGRVTALPMSL
jgi:tRNA-modifying protein YgfZ